jgi:hypothetical protein
MSAFADDKCPCGRPWEKCPWRWDAKTERCPLKSVALERLIEEVRNGGATANVYNRVYNRHNRS